MDVAQHYGRVHVICRINGRLAEMKTKFASLLVIGLIGSSTIARADSLYDFTWTGGGGVSASGTLDVSNGNVDSVTGTISGGGLPGAESLSLITAGDAGTSVPDPSNPAPSSFTFETGGGDVFEGDTVFSTASPYVDVYGLVFAVGSETGGSSGGALYAFNVWGNAPGNWQASLAGADGIPANRIYTVNQYGTFTISAVPAPSAAWSMLAGLVLFGGRVLRRRRSVER